MSTFSDRYEEQTLLLLLAEHGESVFYRSAAGEERDITAMVKHSQRTVEGKIDYENEVIHTTVYRSEDTGINDPKRGETLEWQTDIETTPFAFTGRIVRSLKSVWTLEFSRPKATAIGGKEVRRVLGR